ncbi:MAG: fatty acid desaturase family protein [Pseudomonadales bacterium]
MSKLRTLLRDPTSLWPNTIAMGYILLAYGGGWWALFQDSIWLFALGVVALAHGMTIAGYLMHDCGHNSIFKTNEHNAWLGRWLNVICGTNYGTYEDMRYKHMRHHVDNCEPVTFDYRAWLQRRPRVHQLVNALEWAYIPAVELIMHGMQIAAPFVYEDKRSLRVRVVRVAAIRFSLFALILWFAPLAALGYVLAYLLMLTLLRFLDNFQHNYEIFYRLNDPHFVPPRKGDGRYEETHTYSNLLSARWPWLNLLALNFPYHNAHHARPTMSWHRLPAFHRERYPDGCGQQLKLRDQLISFHRHRVARVLSEHYGEADVIDQLRRREAVGVNALSFLTAF